MASEKTNPNLVVTKNIPRGVKELADLTNIPYRTLIRTLHKLEKSHGNVLCKSTSNRFYVNVPGLLKAWPGFGTSIPTQKDIEETTEVQREQERQILTLAKEIRDLKIRVNQLERRGAIVREAEELRRTLAEQSPAA